MKGRFTGARPRPVHLVVRAIRPGCKRLIGTSPWSLRAMEMASTSRFFLDQRIRWNLKPHVCSRSVRSVAAPKS